MLGFTFSVGDTTRTVIISTYLVNQIELETLNTIFSVVSLV